MCTAQIAVPPQCNSTPELWFMRFRCAVNLRFVMRFIQYEVCFTITTNVLGKVHYEMAVSLLWSCMEQTDASISSFVDDHFDAAFLDKKQACNEYELCYCQLFWFQAAPIYMHRPWDDTDFTNFLSMFHNEKRQIDLWSLQTYWLAAVISVKNA